MSSLTLTRKNVLPTWTSELLDSGRFFNPRLLDFDNDLKWDVTSQIPSVNIIENDSHFKIEMAVPGYEKNDFKINVTNDILTISAEKKAEKKEKNDKYTRREFSFSTFERSFSLPENSKTEQIDAKYENGILRLNLPKKEIVSAKPAKEIKVG